MKQKLLVFLSVLMVFTTIGSWPTSVSAQPSFFGGNNPFGSGNTPFGSQFNASDNKKDPLNLDHAATADDVFHHEDFDCIYPPTVPLEGTKLSGLNDTALKVLGTSYIVAINDAKHSTFADIYKQNKLNGKSNYVTFDSLLHAALAHRNGITSSVLESKGKTQLLALLKAMVEASLYDYKMSTDEAVQDDIARNLAFLTVAIKLLAVDSKLPDLGAANDLAAQDYLNIKAEKPAMSAIFKRQENFALFKPQGWYNSSENLRNYFRCRQWLGRMYLTLSDVTNNTKAGTGNEFRRAVLLFRTLARAKFGEATGLTAWHALFANWAVLDATSGIAPGALLPSNFEPVFQVNDELKATLLSLSDPLKRTRLFLALKGKERPQLDTTSLTELTAKDRKFDQKLTFRLFPPIEQPEIGWLSSQIIKDRDADEGGSEVPAGLIFLHAHNFRYADNVLIDGASRMDDGFVTSIPSLDRIVRKGETGANAAGGIWQILAGYVNSAPDGAQNSLKTPSWLGCRLESTIAGWIDSQTALDKRSAEAVANSATPVAASATAQLKRTTNFHYLEPAIDNYKALAKNLEQYEESLTRVGLFPESYRSKNADFVRLARRLAEISAKELSGHALDAADVGLLANIDQVLEQIDFPVGGHIFISFESVGGYVPRDDEEGGTKRKLTTMIKSRKGGELKVIANDKNGITAPPAESPPVRPKSRNPLDMTTISLDQDKSESILDEYDASKTTKAKGRDLTGTNLALGGATPVSIILSGPRGSMIARGAVYAYYEVPGPSMTDEGWARKLEYGFVKQPHWCDAFQYFDQATATH